MAPNITSSDPSPFLITAISKLDDYDKKHQPKLIEYYKHLRLSALQLSPEAFASTYAQESLYTDKTWQQRLQNPDAHHIVAQRSSGESAQGFGNIFDTQWIGMIVVLRRSESEEVNPSKSPWTDGRIEASVKEERDKVSFLLNGFFVHPSARRCGIGEQLVRAALAHVRSVMVEHRIERMRTTVLVDCANVAALALYQRCGFEIERETMYRVGESQPRTVKVLFQHVKLD